MGFNTDILSATTISGGTFYGDGSGLVDNTITEIINSPTQNPLNVNTSNDYLPITGNDQYQDEASNYISWTNGSNNGTGFNPWTITAQPNTGVFLGNPASDGMGTVGIGTNAFAIFATDGSNYVATSRTFTSGMNVGDVFSFYWVINFDANGGNKGFDLKAGGTTIFNANNNNTSTITSNLSSPNNIIDSGYGTTPMLVTLTRTSDILYNITITSRSGGPTYSASINSPLVVNEINFYCGAQGDGLGQRNLFFNQLLITKTTELLKITVDDLGSLFGGGSLYEVGSGTDSTQRIGVSGDASGDYSLVGGGTGNTSSGDYSFVGGGKCNTSSAVYSTVSGGRENTSSGQYSNVNGGYFNTSSGNYSTVSGGGGNTSSGYYSTVGGGLQNTSSGYGSTVSGGGGNTSSGYYSTISAGQGNKTATIINTISGYYSQTYSGTITGSYNVSPSSTSSGYGTGSSFNLDLYSGTVSGYNSPTYAGSTASGYYGPFNPTSAGIPGGSGAQFGFNFSTPGTLSNVYINTSGQDYTNGDTLTFDGTLFGGGPGTDDVTIGITTSSYVIVSINNGGQNYINGDTLNFNGSLFGGSGTDDVTLNINTSSNGQFSTIGGGRCNTSSGGYSFIGGGRGNTSSGEDSTVSGGYNNRAIGNYSTVSGGRQNTSSCNYSTVSGGYRNTSIGCYSTISGGRCNTSSGYLSTVSGGRCNTAINGCSAILGGQCNTSQHDCSFIVGSGIFSTAANTLHINCLNIKDLPDETAIGLPLGTVFYDSTTCNLCVCL
jgi:hypothetical protein